VLTSVTRDDLPDGGASHWAATLRAVRAAAPTVSIEALVPDFGGSPESLRTVFEARPDVFGHNLETVPRLYPVVRSGADYARSLDVLRAAAAFGLVTKTSLMLGLGETDDEVLETLRDARGVGVSIAFLGQYLPPSADHAPVLRYVSPDGFNALRARALELGFDTVRAAPLLRSSTPPGVADA
jgi:lipoic acid synthetase